MPLVSFTTRAGQQRRLVPLTSRYEDPPTAGFPDRGRAETSHCHAPPIGHQVRVVYEPVDPTSADEHVGAPMLALSMIFHLVMIALFGALLIATGRGTTWLRLIQARRVIVNPRDATHTRRLQETAAIAKILNNLGSGENP